LLLVEEATVITEMGITMVTMMDIIEMTITTEIVVIMMNGKNMVTMEADIVEEATTEVVVAATAVSSYRLFDRFIQKANTLGFTSFGAFYNFEFNAGAFF
jgi:hypothetical protein